ncbi:MAG: T9SS type A sorting domain-containing protein [Bacteroidales bacterium]
MNKIFLFLLKISFVFMLFIPLSSVGEDNGTNVPDLSSSGDALKPPTSIQTVFESNFDPSKSDTFDSTALDTDKWTFRTQGGARFLTLDEVNWRKGANITYGNVDEKTGEKFVSIEAAAKGSSMGSDALTSKFRTKYGFYIARFRMKGLTTNVRPVQHPAIWSAWKNFSDLEYRSINGDENGIVQNQSSDRDPANWLEVDFVELYDNAPAWKMLTLTHDRESAGWVNAKQFATSESNLTATSNDWQTIGFEFRENYIRFWRYTNNQWIAEPKTISIKEGGSNANVTNPSTPTAEIDKLNADREMYWILSNVRFMPIADRDSDNDVFFEIDCFLYYPIINTTTGINKVKKKSLNLFPNPAQNELKIESDSPVIKTNITSVLGKNVLSFAKINLLDISKLTKGMYVASVLLEDVSVTSKFFIKK